MNQTTLTKDDLNVLIEALDAWVNRDFTGEFVGDMIGMMMQKDKEGQQKILAERKKRQQEKEQQNRNEQEIATLLKAKLILIKQKL